MKMQPCHAVPLSPVLFGEEQETHQSKVEHKALRQAEQQLAAGVEMLDNAHALQSSLKRWAHC